MSEIKCVGLIADPLVESCQIRVALQCKGIRLRDGLRIREKSASERWYSRGTRGAYSYVLMFIRFHGRSRLHLRYAHSLSVLCTVRERSGVALAENDLQGRL